MVILKFVTIYDDFHLVITDGQWYFLKYLQNVIFEDNLFANWFIGNLMREESGKLIKVTDKQWYSIKNKTKYIKVKDIKKITDCEVTNAIHTAATMEDEKNENKKVTDDDNTYTGKIVTASSELFNLLIFLCAQYAMRRLTEKASAEMAKAILDKKDTTKTPGDRDGPQGDSLFWNFCSEWIPDFRLKFTTDAYKIYSGESKDEFTKLMDDEGDEVLKPLIEYFEINDLNDAERMRAVTELWKNAPEDRKLKKAIDVLYDRNRNYGNFIMKEGYYSENAYNVIRWGYLLDKVSGNSMGEWVNSMIPDLNIIFDVLQVNDDAKEMIAGIFQKLGTGNSMVILNTFATALFWGSMVLSVAEIVYLIKDVYDIITKGGSKRKLLYKLITIGYYVMNLSGLSGSMFFTVVAQKATQLDQKNIRKAVVYANLTYEVIKTLPFNYALKKINQKIINDDLISTQDKTKKAMYTIGSVVKKTFNNTSSFIKRTLKRKRTEEGVNNQTNKKNKLSPITQDIKKVEEEPVIKMEEDESDNMQTPVFPKIYKRSTRQSIKEQKRWAKNGRLRKKRGFDKYI